MVIKNEEYKEQILQMYHEHGNGGRIAKYLGITNYRVYKCLRENDIEPKKVGGKEKHSAEKMVDMYNGGMSTTEIADKLNMNQVSVWERLKTNGVQLRTRSEASELRGHTKIKKSDEQDVLEMYKNGMTYRQIAKEYCAHMDAVGRVLKKHNVRPRDMYGSNNHAWKGGRLKLNKLIRNSARYIEFRDHMMKKRNYTCELTGERGGKLNVHHIKPFAQLIDEFVAQNNENIDSDERREELYGATVDFEPFWEESNVIVVTEDKHKWLHSTKCDDGHISLSFGKNGWHMGYHCVRCGSMNFYDLFRDDTVTHPYKTYVIKSHKVVDTD